MNRAIKGLKSVRRNDQGFTLIELLITVVILGVIISALGTSLFVGLQLTSATSRRLAEAHDAQLITSYFPFDVQSSDSVTATALDARATATVTGTPVVSLGWMTQAGVLKVAAYVTQTNTASECPSGYLCSLMVRYFWNGTSNAATVVAHLLNRTSSASLSCQTAGVPGGCPSGATGAPDAMILSVTPVDTSIYAPYAVAGTRRESL